MRRVLTILLVPSLYVLSVVIIFRVTGQLEAAQLLRVDFLIGLVISVFMGLAMPLRPQPLWSHVSRFVILVLFILGFTLIISSRNISYWDDAPPWNPSVLGAGTSIAALAFAFLFVSLPRSRAPHNGEDTRLLPVSHTEPCHVRLITNITTGKHRLLVLGFLLTLTLLIVLAILQRLAPAAMQLDTKWIAVAAIPTVLALIAGGYVKAIRGFGFDLEFWINQPIGTALDLKVGEVHILAGGILTKEDINHLNSLSMDYRRSVRRLQLFTRNPHYYDEYVLTTYMHGLPNLEYFEIARPWGEFICLIPVDLFYRGTTRERSDIDELSRFLRSLEQDTVMEMYAADAVSLAVRANQSIIDALESLYTQGATTAVTVDSKGRAIGIVHLADIEGRITRQVIVEAKRRSKSS